MTHISCSTGFAIWVVPLTLGDSRNFHDPDLLTKVELPTVKQSVLCSVKVALRLPLTEETRTHCLFLYHGVTVIDSDAHVTICNI